jgi:two-component system, cell cycle sensor histidine kinase and response regulator CckA
LRKIRDLGILLVAASRRFALRAIFGGGARATNQLRPRALVSVGAMPHHCRAVARENDQLERELQAMRAELAALRATEAKYRSVIAAMTEGVVVHDEAGRIVTCNAAAEAILGLTSDQMGGRTSLDPRWRSIHEDGRPFPGDDHPAMVTLRTGEPRRDVIMGVHKPDGRLTWIAINSQPIPAAEPGAPRVVCTFSDITAHRQALADLQGSEARLQLAMRAARMGTWQWEVGEDRVIWSETVADVFGTPRGEFQGGFEPYLALIHPDDRALVRAEIEGVLGAGADRDSFHVRHRVGGGPSDHWVECHGRLFRDGQGRPVRMAGVALDISDVRRLEQRVHQSQRLEAIGRLAGGIAHDFNNVLTVILSAVELQARRGAPTAEIQMIKDAAQRAAQLTAQLLAFARRRAAGVENVELGILIENLRPLLVRLLGERIALEVTIAPGPWFVRADAGQLEQVLINLVANARDAIADSGHVWISIEAAGDEVALVVGDDGAGMSPEVIERVFEPFFTTKPSGTGLGLATSYGIVVQHGGRFEVTSTVGRGTRFEVRLPWVRGDAAPTPEPPAARALGSRGHETVLLVEDDAMIRQVAEQVLAEAGYRVLAAADGVDAVALAHAHAGELAGVVTDAVMPRMGGAELANQLRAAWPSLPILFVSGYDPDVQPGAGAQPRLDKPYTPATLLACVRALLDRSAS